MSSSAALNIGAPAWPSHAFDGAVGSHTVLFYEDDAFLIDSLSKLVGATFLSGDTAIIIATRAHRDELARRLTSHGIDVVLATKQGIYRALDAAETLSSVTVDGTLNEAALRTFAGSLLSPARADQKTRRLFVFGEMVALLWSQGNVDAAIKLEQLWNSLCSQYVLDLHCAYSMKGFDRANQSRAFLTICGEHSHVIPTENYTALGDDDARLRQISSLQQRAQTAEEEIAERKEAQKSLQAFFHHGHSLAFIMKPDGTLVDVNTSAIAQSGATRADLIGRRIWDCPWWSGLPVEQQTLRASVATAAAGQDARGDCSYLDHHGAAKGSERFAERSITPVSNDSGEVTLLVGSCNDITDRVRAEEALRKSEKLAATGRLAATIAHEINNPLEAISNAIYLARNSSSPNLETYLKLADEELSRVAQITKQTLGFYRENGSPSIVRVSTILEELLALYSRKIQAKGLTVRKQYRDEVEIWGLEGELRQVFANQITNAIYAMPQGGCLTIRIRKSKSWSNGQSAGITVSLVDTGSGIPQESLGRIFEPFYTTKQDVGTGLGLWITNNIVHRHGGYIRARSSVRPGASGTIFTTFLPQHGGEVHPHA